MMLKKEKNYPRRIIVILLIIILLNAYFFLISSETTRLNLLKPDNLETSYIEYNNQILLSHVLTKRNNVKILFTLLFLVFPIKIIDTNNNKICLLGKNNSVFYKIIKKKLFLITRFNRSKYKPSLIFK